MMSLARPLNDDDDDPSLLSALCRVLLQPHLLVTGRCGEVLASVGANPVAVQKGNEDAPWVKTLLEAYHSDEIKAFIDESYHGTVITSW